jgi:hypothetical protein
MPLHKGVSVANIGDGRRTLFCLTPRSAARRLVAGGLSSCRHCQLGAHRRRALVYGPAPH